MKLRHVFAVVVCAAFVAAYTFAATRTQMKVETQKEYSVYASFYPIYSIGKSLLEGVPGIRLNQLIQPTDNDISVYTLSDWDSALLNSADIIINGGSGLEPFAGYSNSHSIVINLLTSGEMIQREDGMPNPWVFMSLDGMQYAAEALCANMITADEGYEQLYLGNLEKFSASVDALRNDAGKLSYDGKVAITHDAFEYLMKDIGIDYVRINDANDLREAAKSQINTVFCDRAFMSEYADTIKENGMTAVCLDTGMAHGMGDSKSWTDIYGENISKITAELSR